MEKADILEMTVAYLRATECRRRAGPTASGGGADRYAVGFRECAVRVGQYLLDAGVNPGGAVHDRLRAHLERALRAAVAGASGRGVSVGTTDGQAAWTGGDVDTSGRCSPSTDDDDDDDDDDECRSASGTAVSDADDVIQRRYAAPGTTLQLLTDTPTPTTAAATTSAYRQSLHPDGDSPRTADEFPTSFPPPSTSIGADYSTSLPRHVVDDIDNELVVLARDVTRDVIVTCSGDVMTSGSDVVTDDDSADLWQPWR